MTPEASTRDAVAGELLRVFVVDCHAALTALEQHEKLHPLLSPVERQRFLKIEKSRGLEDARLWRASHIALRIVLSRFAGGLFDGASFSVTAAGRPYLEGARAPSFSLAHSGALAVIAVGGKGPIGVDLETARPVRMSGERQRRIVVAAAALGPLRRLPDCDDAERFLTAWVRLEAFAKACDFGIGRVLTAAGAVGGEGGGRFAELAGEGGALGGIVDLDLGAGRFGAVFAPDPPPHVGVEALPASFAGLSAFAAGAMGQ